jgi:rod shape-determining protein MreC
VITGIGVVGRITAVAPNYSQVSTIVSTEIAIGVLTTNNNVKGVLQNDIIYAVDGLARVSHIGRDAVIEEGDIFVTAGSDMHPDGLIIGEVVGVYDDPNGISKHALVKPSENLRQLTNVLVVTGFEGRQPIVIENLDSE